MSPENTMRQFEGLRYPEALIICAHYMSKTHIDSQLQFEVEKQLRIYQEVYLSKILETENLISIFDFAMLSVQEEILTESL